MLKIYYIQTLKLNLNNFKLSKINQIQYQLKYLQNLLQLRQFLM
jgi:hypothetical protein